MPRQRELAAGESGSVAVVEITFLSCRPEPGIVGAAVRRALFRQGMEVPGKVAIRKAAIN